jgi:glycosyltransferase involved in cell wall biosynthesis
MRSDDRTAEIAAPLADRVISQERMEGFDAGRERAFAAAKSDWIFSIDADELATPKLGRWIREFVDSDPPFDVALIPRINVFLGRWVRSSPWWPGKPRLFRRGAIVVTPELHHGLVPIDGARIAHLPRDPQLSMWHFTFNSMSSMLERTNRYTTIEAHQALAAGRNRPRATELISRPLRALAPYVLRRGYRDGMAGLAYAADRAYYELVSALKRWDEPRAAERLERYDRMKAQLLDGTLEPPLTDD